MILVKYKLLRKLLPTLANFILLSSILRHILDFAALNARVFASTSSKVSAILIKINAVGIGNLSHLAGPSLRPPLLSTCHITYSKVMLKSLGTRVQPCLLRIMSVWPPSTFVVSLVDSAGPNCNVVNSVMCLLNVYEQVPAVLILLSVYLKILTNYEHLIDADFSTKPC